MLNLSGKTIIVTGAASGIGRRTCMTISELGAKVVLLDISKVGMEETLSHLQGEGHLCCEIDLSNLALIPDLVKKIVSECGIIDGFVHCAGISSRKPLNVLKKDGFSKLLDINFFSFVEFVKQLARKGNFHEGGSIVVMSSISSIRGYKAKAEYCVSKASVDAFVRCMALELAPRRIRVNSIMPAVVLTPMAQKARELGTILEQEEFSSPLGPTEPYEVANLISFLLSDATKTITGTSILIDGGATI